MDSSNDEAAALIPMLELLFEEWPDCPVQRIVGGSAWDEDWANRLCEVNYGIHPIFRLGQGRNHRKQFAPGTSRDGTIAGITADGQLLCAAHNKPLSYQALQRPPRTFKPKDGEPKKPDLRPGEPTNPDAFRVRVSGTCGCTASTTFACKNDWSRLTYYPHHHNGRPDLYAERVAWIDRLSGMESFHNRLKSRGLATGGADRTRITDMDAVQCLIELSSLVMVAAVLYDQRDLHGHSPVSLAVPESGEIKPGDGLSLDDLKEAA